MNTARIVVLTIAVGAGCVAAYASGSDNKPFPTEPAAQLRNMDAPGKSEMPTHSRQTDPLLMALGSTSPKGRMI